MRHKSTVKLCHIRRTYIHSRHSGRAWQPSPTRRFWHPAQKRTSANIGIERAILCGRTQRSAPTMIFPIATAEFGTLLLQGYGMPTPRLYWIQRLAAIRISAVNEKHCCPLRITPQRFNDTKFTFKHLNNRYCLCIAII